MKIFVSITVAMMAFGSALWGQALTFDSLRKAAPGIALGLAEVQGDGAPVIRTEGPLARGASQQVANDARWHIGSITKSMTATLVMQQVDRGTLDIHAPIGGYLQNFDDIHADMQKLTLYQLMSHTSGLRANPSIKHLSQLRSLEAFAGRRQVLADFWSDPPKSAPGTHLYSNLGYMLIGVVLEEVTGLPWEELVKKELADPLGLSTLGFGPPPDETDPQGHRNFIVILKPMPRDDHASDNPAWLGPAGTVHMSLGDLLRYGQAHLAACKGEMPEFLSQVSCKLMQTPVADSYGFGWVNQNGTVWHNGSNTMWYAVLLLDPETEKVVALTQNAMRRPGQIDAFARSIMEN